MLARIAGGSTAQEARAEVQNANVFPIGTFQSILTYIGYRKDTDNKEISLSFEVPEVKGVDGKPRRLYVSFDWKFLIDTATDAVCVKEILAFTDLFSVAKSYPDLYTFFNLVWETGMMKGSESGDKIGHPRYRAISLLGRIVDMKVRHNIPKEGKYKGQTFAQTSFAFSRTKDGAAAQKEVNGDGFKISGDEITSAWLALSKAGIVSKLIALREDQNIGIAPDGNYDFVVSTAKETDGTLMLVLSPEGQSRSIVYLNSSRDEQADIITDLVTKSVAVLSEAGKEFKDASSLIGLKVNGDLGSFTTNTGREYQTLDLVNEVEIVASVPTTPKPIIPKSAPVESSSEAPIDEMPKGDELDDPFAE